MNWRTDKPTAEIIVALISDGGGYDVLYRRDDGKYVDRYDELPYSLIEKWADLEEDETVTDCHQLEEEVTRYLRKKCSADDEPSVSEIARHFANWQEEQDHYACQQCEKDYGNVFYKGEQHARKMMEKENRKIIELAEDHAMLAGMVKKEEEMREKALELTVCLDDSGHPYIPEIVLFDFDKNQPTAKVGDTIGVYLFKNR